MLKGEGQDCGGGAALPKPPSVRPVLKIPSPKSEMRVHTSVACVSKTQEIVQVAVFAS